MVSDFAGSTHEAKKTLPSVLIRSMGFLPKVYHHRLLANSPCAVVDEAVDSKLIKKANPVIANGCVCLINQAIYALSENAQIGL